MASRIGADPGYVKLGDRLDRKYLRWVIAQHLNGKTAYISIGRSSNRAGFSNSTPIKFVDGDAPPELRGKPCLATNFRRGRFSKTLYTPSTLHVVVGRDWEPIRRIVKEVDNGQQNRG